MIRVPSAQQFFSNLDLHCIYCLCTTHMRSRPARMHRVPHIISRPAILHHVTRIGSRPAIMRCMACREFEPVALRHHCAPYIT
jgi:hypothetical protein